MILSRARRAPPELRKVPAYDRRGDIVKVGGRSVLRPARPRVYGSTYLAATARTAPTRVPPRGAQSALPPPEPDREQDHDRRFDSGGVRRRGSRPTRGSHPDVPGGGEDRRGAPAANAARHHHLADGRDRKSTRLNSSHITISYAVFCLKKK